MFFLFPVSEPGHPCDSSAETVDKNHSFDPSCGSSQLWDPTIGPTQALEIWGYSLFFCASVSLSTNRDGAVAVSWGALHRDCSTAVELIE